jgi:hypothetical protein
MASPANRNGQRAIKLGPGQRLVDGASLRLADEVRYIQRRAADHDGRVVTIGQLTLFSSETGDAWLIDRDDHLALRLARDGDPEPTSKKPTLPSRSTGRAATASKAQPSSTPSATPAAPQPSSATRPKKSLSQNDREISNMFGGACLFNRGGNVLARVPRCRGRGQDPFWSRPFAC